MLLVSRSYKIQNYPDLVERLAKEFLSKDYVFSLNSSKNLGMVD